MKKIAWLFGVLLFVWIFMLFELWLILQVIVPLTLEANSPLGALLTGVMKVGAGALSVILWLWLWRKVECVLFWRVFKKAYKEKT